MDNLKDANALLFGWDNFREMIKYKWRYTFFLEKKGRGVYKNSLSPVETLKNISNLLKNQRELLTDLTPDIPIYRGRPFKFLDNYDNAKSLGTPPDDIAKQPNRFSPVGQAVFYGAFDAKTVINEINTCENYLVIGEFHVSKSTKVLDLTEIPEPKEPYDYNNPEVLALLFLSGLSKSVSSPVCDSLCLDYIPTQVFAEYIRRIKIENNKIRGIKYWSAQNESKKNIVLFYSNKECVDSNNSKKCCLILKDCCVYTRNKSYSVYTPLASMF